jgi:glutathione synthase
LFIRHKVDIIGIMAGTARKGALRIGVVMDPIDHIKPAKDSTLAMMLAAQARGADLFYMGQDDLFIKDGAAWARMAGVTVADDAHRWYELRAPAVARLGDLDIVLMRKDPPVDKRFIHACYVLDRARRDGARVVNDPLALVDYNEKILATHFPQYCPPYVIGADRDVLREFMRAHERIIIKPLDSMGGEGVFLLHQDDVNFDVIWEVQTRRGTYPVVAQAFIPEISAGDMRVVVFGGKPYGHALVRTPQRGSIRGNMAAGGTTTVRPLTDREHEIATAVGCVLAEKGVVFAGLDIIGPYLTEVNITSPTGLRQLEKSTGDHVAGLLMDTIIKS